MEVERCQGAWGEMSKEKPNIVCLCGSTKFVDVMAVLAWELEKKGEIVWGCNLLPAWYGVLGAHIAEKEGVADILDQLHLAKIRLADRVVIVNVNGYIGEQTQREIEFAESLGKPISYLEPVEVVR